MKNETFWFIITLILWGVLVTTCCTGCLSSFLPSTSPNVDDIKQDNPVKSLITSMNWLATFCVLAIGLSVFALANGNKLGLAGIVASIVTLVASIIVTQYATWIAFFGLVVCVVAAGLLALTIFKKDKALKEIIGNIEDYKKVFINAKDTMKEVFSKQSDSTKEIIKKVKGE